MTCCSASGRSRSSVPGRHRSSSIAVVSASPSVSFSGPRRRQMLERVHPDRPLSAERGQRLSLVQRLGMVPSHLEHDFVSLAVGARRHPRAVASRLEWLVEVQLPARLSAPRLVPVARPTTPLAPDRRGRSRPVGRWVSAASRSCPHIVGLVRDSPRGLLKSATSHSRGCPQRPGGWDRLREPRCSLPMSNRRERWRVRDPSRTRM